MKFTPQTDRILITYEDIGSRLATWTKAIFWVPVWYYPLIPISGSLLHALNLDTEGFIALVLFALTTFGLDLARKRIVLDQRRLSHGLTRLDISNITSIDLAKPGRSRGPKALRICDKSGRQLALRHSHLQPTDIRTLINTVRRMSPSCKIDPEIDAILRYKTVSLLPGLHDTSSTVYIPYHVDRTWENLFGTFCHLLTGWSRFFGPLGVGLLFFPIAISLISFLYSITFSQWSNYSAHKTMYDSLISWCMLWGELQGNAWLTGVSLLEKSQLLGHPLLLLASTVVVAATALKIVRAEFGPNRLTLNDQEFSMDHWAWAYSYKIFTTKWTEITSLSLSSDRDKRRIKLCLKNGTAAKLDIDGIDEHDRSRLLQSIKRFAPLCQIDAEVHEMLEPPTDKSYTQLWLQSVALAPQSMSLKPIEAGTTLEDGRYEVVRKLGVGGQGTAYLCYDLADKEQKAAPLVALKHILIPPYLSAPVRKTVIERFFAEAVLLRNIESDHVVKLIDYFIDERGAYLVLEHIEGKTLRQLVTEGGAIDTERATELVAQMLDILKTLHSSEIVHRDFTPDNLILRPDGMLKLIDFNVAHEESEGTTATIVGKHAYVPPEQFRGKPCQQSDLYALGATIFYLLTGADPEPISQSSLSAELQNSNPYLSDLVKNCTAVNLNDRAKCVDELIMQKAPDITSVETDDSQEGTTINIATGARLKLEKQVAR